MTMFSRMRQEVRFLAVAFLFLSLALGCQGGKAVLKDEEIPPQPVAKVTFGPGDVLDVKFFHAPELNESQTVRPDGRITLQLVGEVPVAGKSPDELRAELTRLYTPELKNPEVAVIARSFYERRVYVGGEVKTPGLIAMPGPLTALEAIMQAGGFNARTAQRKNVVIIRHKDGKRYGCALDLSGALKGEEGRPFYLEPHDIVYVPRTTIAKVNQWIDQYITKIVPRTGFNINYPIGFGTVGLDTSNTVFVP
jgi:polysaccharide export outer membrane protein